MSSRVRAAVVGVDVGTSGVRALLVDDRGEIVAQQTRGDGFEIAAPRQGWAEQQPERWWQAACAAIGAVVAEAGTAFEVRAVGLTGQMHSSVFLDTQRRVLRPALLWCDGRTEAQCREIDERLGGRTVALCGNLAFAGFTAPKLLWLREHEPERYAALDALLLPKDFVRLRLADDSDDALCTDVSDASGTLLLDIGGRRWSSEVLEALEIDAALLPRALESSEWSAEVGAAAAERCGLEPGTPIVAGAGDQAAGATGLGCSARGRRRRAALSLGTSGVVFAPTPRYTPDPRGRLHAFCYTDADSWHVMGVILAAAACQRWFRQLLGEDAQAPSFDALDDEIAASPPGAEGLLWLPYLSGERTPHNDPNARAVLAGASLAHGRAHVLRAIAEGVAFALADCFDLLADPCGVEVDELLVSGGGARGDNQCQIIADVLGREIARPAVDEGPAYGAALLAGEAAALWTREAMAEQLVIERRFEPRGELRALYDEARGRFGELYRALYA